MADASLFIFGVARSGTNLVARMLDMHPSVAVALDPLMPLLRLWRNLALAGQTSERAFDPSASFHDYFFSPEGASLLDKMMAASANLPVDPAAAESLRQSIIDRAALESPQLAERLSDVGGATVADILRCALDRIAANAADEHGKRPSFVGSKELWTAEFAMPLLRELGNAKFVMLYRDPRAVIASLLEMSRRDETQAAHAVSYLRHWRKHVAVARHLSALGVMDGRMLVLRYEDLLADWRDCAERLTDFLGLPYAEEMAQPGGTSWRGNSSFGPLGTPIDTAGSERWREHLPADMLATVEFYCGAEMDLLGYERDLTARDLDPVVARETFAAHRAPGKWRSDSGHVAADLAWESLRDGMLKGDSADWPSDLVRQCFLFEDMFRELREMRGVSNG